MSHQECNIPVAFVPLNFTNDPETEDLIFGDELTEGMVVLLGGMTRFNPDNYESASQYEKNRILETARWCRVVSIRREGSVTVFIGVYGDGTKHKRSHKNSFAWYVKKDSIPD